MRTQNELDLFILQRFRGHFSTVVQYFSGGQEEIGGSLFTRSHMEMTRGKLQQQKVHFGIGKKFFQ